MMLVFFVLPLGALFTKMAELTMRGPREAARSFASTENDRTIEYRHPFHVVVTLGGWMWLTVAAWSQPITGAVTLDWVDNHYCAQVGDQQTLCWRDREKASPRPELEEKLRTRSLPRPVRGVFDPPQDVRSSTRIGDSTCIIDMERNVWCRGDAWRELLGFPEGTPTEEPVLVPLLSGAEQIAGNCVLRAQEVVCATAAGLETRLRGVRTFDARGLALLEDGTGWAWRTSPARQEIEDVVALTRDLVQRKDGSIHRTRGGRFYDLVGSDPPGLQGSITSGCALTKGGGVTCWGPPAPQTAYWWPRDKRPAYRYRKKNEHTPMRRTAPTCTLEGTDVTCIAGPTEAIVRMTGVESLVTARALTCVKRAQAVSCVGFHRKRSIQEDEGGLEGIVDLVASDESVFALRADGEVLVAGWMKHGDAWKLWNAVGRVEGATRLGARGRLVCAQKDDDLHCAQTTQPDDWIVLELPKGNEPSADLCLDDRCLHPDTPDTQATELWVVESKEAP